MAMICLGLGGCSSEPAEATPEEIAAQEAEEKETVAAEDAENRQERLKPDE